MLGIVEDKLLPESLPHPLSISSVPLQFKINKTHSASCLLPTFEALKCSTNVCSVSLLKAFVRERPPSLLLILLTLPCCAMNAVYPQQSLSRQK